jgi:hypothetical protein
MEETYTDLLADLEEADVDDEAKGELAINCILNFATWLKKTPVPSTRKRQSVITY